MPIILSKTFDGERAEYHLRVPENLLWFKGHFPELSILPGVVQVDWVMHFIQDLKIELAVIDNFSRIDQLKFKRLILPAKELNLRLEISQDLQRVKFRYFDEDGVFSMGSIVLKA